MRSVYASLVARFHNSVRCALGAALLCAPFLTWASVSTDVPHITPTSNGWAFDFTKGTYKSAGGDGVLGDLLNRSYSAAATAGEAAFGEVKVKDMGMLVRDKYGVFAPSVGVAVERRIAWSAVARAAAKTLPLVGPASVAYDIWQAMGCELQGTKIACTMSPDPFAPGSGPWRSQATPNGEGYGTAEAACKARCVKAGLDYHSLTTPVVSGAICRCFNSSHTGITNNGNVYNDVQCPTGTSLQNGLCISPNKVPKTEDEAAGYFESKAPGVTGSSGKNGKQKAPDIVQEADKKGQGSPAGAPSVSGPAQQYGKPKTTTETGPSGTTTTTTTNTYNYNYNNTTNGGTVTYTTTTNTTVNVTNNAGETTTTTNTTTDGEPVDDTSECEKSPDTLGCQKLGEVDDEEINKVTKDVSVQAESVNLPAGCPAPLTAAGYSLSFDAACTFSRGVNPFVIAAAAIMAAMIVIRSIQGA